MSHAEQGESQVKGRYKCPSCGRHFVTPVSEIVRCRKCKVAALTVCRRGGHARDWKSGSLQMCKPCVDFAVLHASGGLTSTPTGRLSDRSSRAQNWTGRPSSAPTPRKNSR